MRSPALSSAPHGIVAWLLLNAVLAGAVAAQGCPEQDLGSNLPISVSGTTALKPNLLDPVGGSFNEQFLCLSAAPEATFRFTPPFSGTFRIDTFGSQYDTLVYVRDLDCQGATLCLDTNCAVCADDVLPSLQSQLVLDLQEGQPIVIIVDGFGNSQGELQLNIAADPMVTATPTIDDGSATPTPVAGVCPAGDLGSAVPAVAPLLDSGSRSAGSASCGGDTSNQVTFAFTAPEPGTFTFAAAQASTLSVRDGDCSGTEIACDGEAPALASVELTTGQTVVVIAEGFFGSFGDAKLFVYKDAACPIEAFSAVPASLTYDPAVGLSNAFGCCGGDCGPEATFAFTAPQTGSYLISTLGSADDTQLLLANGQCDNPDVVACNDDAPLSLQSELTLDLLQGQQIHIAVKGALSPLRLNVSQGTPTPQPTPPAGSLRAYVANELDGAVSVLSVPPRSGIACSAAQPCAAGTVCVGGACMIPPQLLGTICMDQVPKPGSDFFPRVLRVSRDGTLAYVGGRLAFRADGRRASRQELVIVDTNSLNQVHPRACALAQVAGSGFSLNFSIAELLLAFNELSLLVAAPEKNALVILANPFLDPFGPSTSFDAGRNPADVTVSPDGSVVYVSNSDDGTLSVLRLDDSARTTVTVGTRPAALGISPDGQQVYVANSGGSSVSVVDTQLALSDPAAAVVATVTVGSMPLGLAVASDGAAVWVANAGDDSVSIIDTGSFSVDTVSAVGAFPARIALTPDGEFAYLTNLGSGQGDGFVSVIDAVTRTVLPFQVAVGRLPLAIEIPPPPPPPTPTETGTTTQTPSITLTPSITPTPTVTSSPTATRTARACSSNAQCLADAPLCSGGFCIDPTRTPTYTSTAQPTRTATRTFTATNTRTAGPVDPPDCCGTIDCGFAPYDCDCDVTCHALGGDCATSDRCIARGGGPQATATATLSPPTPTRTATAPPATATRTGTRTRTIPRTPTATVVPPTHTRTRTSTPTATVAPPTRTGTATATATLAPPSPSATRTAAVTPSITAIIPCSGPTVGPAECLANRQGCVDNRCVCLGDCDGNGIVRAAEITAMVGIINGQRALFTCRPADLNGDGVVRASEVTAAVINVNRQCP